MLLGVEGLVMGVEIIGQLPHLLQADAELLQFEDKLQTSYIVATIKSRTGADTLRETHQANLLVITDGAGGDAELLCQIADLHKFIVFNRH